MNENVQSKTQVRARASLQKAQFENFLTWFKSDVTSNVGILAGAFYKEIAAVLPTGSTAFDPKPVGLPKVTVESFRQGHWLLLTQKEANGEYSRIDPTYGKRLKLSKTPDTGQKTSSYIVLYGRADSFGEQTPEAVKNYKVVRFVTLCAAT